MPNNNRNNTQPPANRPFTANGTIAVHHTSANTTSQPTTQPQLPYADNFTAGGGCIRCWIDQKPMYNMRCVHRYQ
ncbi:hypothetical protein ACHAQA_000722 [Verticillium albo-atrum]